MSGITKVITARGTEFIVGRGEDKWGANVMSINFTVGDPSMGFSAGYSVQLGDGRTVEIEDAVEVWYAAGA